MEAETIAKRIRVMIVDDSAVIRQLLSHILEADPEIVVVRSCGNGEEALRALETDKPDLITMDLFMPGINGLEVTRRIMETSPIPIIIVTAYGDSLKASHAFKVVEAGAVGVLAKPPGSGDPEYEQSCADLVRSIKALSQIKLVRRKSRQQQTGERHLPTEAQRLTSGIAAPIAPSVMPGVTLDSSLRNATQKALSKSKHKVYRVVLIGASTGGPQVIKAIIDDLPENFPLPILVSQHILPGFVEGFARWLNESGKFKARVAVEGVEPQPGHVYLAPDDCHLGFRSDGRLKVDKHGPKEFGHRPTVGYLYRSALAVYKDSAIAILLTGMGRDGAIELKQLREAGSLTIAQDKETSIVWGMPGEAVALDAADHILPSTQIASFLAAITQDAEAKEQTSVELPTKQDIGGSGR